MNLGTTIKNVRKQGGLTQGEFAALCEISQTYLSQIENNLKDPNLSILKNISLKLNVPLPILFFLSITEEDIHPTKRDAFALVGPVLKSVINDVFSLPKK